MNKTILIALLCGFALAGCAEAPTGEAAPPKEPEAKPAEPSEFEKALTATVLGKTEKEQLELLLAQELADKGE